MAEKPYEPKLPLGTVKRWMKAYYPEGNVSKEAVIEMERTLSRVLENITKKSVLIAKNAKRKTIFPEDIDLACQD